MVDVVERPRHQPVVDEELVPHERRQQLVHHRRGRAGEANLLPDVRLKPILRTGRAVGVDDVAEAEADARRPLEPRLALDALLPPNRHGRHHGPSLRSYDHIGALTGSDGEAWNADATAHDDAPVPGKTVKSIRQMPCGEDDPGA